MNHAVGTVMNSIIRNNECASSAFDDVNREGCKNMEGYRGGLRDES